MEEKQIIHVNATIDFIVTQWKTKIIIHSTAQAEGIILNNYPVHYYFSSEEHNYLNSYYINVEDN